MAKKEKKSIADEQDFKKEYSEIFSILGINSENIRHEWNKEGDNIKEFTLFEDHPRPILTPNTYSLNS